MNPLWEKAFAAFHLTPTADQKRALEIYSRELLLFNRKINLVKADDEETLLRRHIFDALAGLPVLGTAGPPTAADVGSGCGIPGSPLAVFWTNTKMTLIERSAKRASFLSYATAVCGLSSRVFVENRDLKEIKTQFDCTVFRAFRPFTEFIIPLLSVTKPGGTLAAFKAKEASALEETACLDKKNTAVRVEILQNPFYDAPRCLAVIQKEPTSSSTQFFQ